MLIRPLGTAVPLSRLIAPRSAPRLDDVGAQIPEGHGCERSGECAGQIQDSQPRQHSVGRTCVREHKTARLRGRRSCANNLSQLIMLAEMSLAAIMGCGTPGRGGPPVL